MLLFLEIILIVTQIKHVLKWTEGLYAPASTLENLVKNSGGIKNTSALCLCRYIFSASGCHGISRETRGSWRRELRGSLVHQRRQRCQENEMGSGTELGKYQVNIKTASVTCFACHCQELFFLLETWSRSPQCWWYYRKCLHEEIIIENEE